MKQKDFLNHDWKIGDILYTIGYKRHNYFKIPVKVVRLRVKEIAPYGWFYVEHNQKDKNLIERYGYDLLTAEKCSELFFTKKQAEKQFTKKYNDFREKDFKRVYDGIVTELNAISREKNALLSLMRVKAMKQNGK